MYNGHSSAGVRSQASMTFSCSALSIPAQAMPRKQSCGHGLTELANFKLEMYALICWTECL